MAVRIEATLACWRIEQRTPNLDVLGEAMADPASATRVDACAALAAIGPSAAAAVPTLEKLLADKEPSVREGAAQALGKIGPAASKASRTLSKLLADEDQLVAAATALALWRVTGEAKASLDMLAKGLKADDRLLKRTCMQYLGEMGQAALPLVPSLVEISQSEDADAARGRPGCAQSYRPLIQ